MKDKTPEKVRRVTEAMLKMVKLDAEDLKNAFEGASVAEPVCF